MNSRSLILLIVALMIAAGTALAVRNRIQQTDVQPAAVASNKVLVAAVNIPAGTFIRADAHLKWVDWPQDTMLNTYVNQSTRKEDEFNGAVSRRNINAGEPITDAILVKTSEGGFMSAVLSPGMRAVSIAVNPTSGNAGFVFPGDRVDLIVTHSIPVQEGTNTTNVVASETFVENVRVLAIDQMLDNPENKAVLAKTITLEVTAKQAEMVNVAADLGKISLALRSLANAKQDQPTGNLDGKTPLEAVATMHEENSMTRDSDVSKLVGGGANAPVNVIRGTTSEKMQFNQKSQ